MPLPGSQNIDGVPNHRTRAVRREYCAAQRVRHRVPRLPV